MNTSLKQTQAAIIQGKRVTFKDMESKFYTLVVEWKKIRNSNSGILVNDAYGQIVAMGWDAVPLLLREVKRESGHWFTALEWITAANISIPEIHGNIRELRKIWLKWGEENGYFIPESV